MDPLSSNSTTDFLQDNISGPPSLMNTTTGPAGELHMWNGGLKDIIYIYIYKFINKNDDDKNLGIFLFHT